MRGAWVSACASTSHADWGARLLFFRCGALTIELVHDLGQGIGEGGNRLWGLSWRVPDIAGDHARLREAKLDLSDLRWGVGRELGSQRCAPTAQGLHPC
jgi:hypothetical protein